MIVILEGIDRVGKTTLARILESKGFLYLKDKFISAELGQGQASMLDAAYSMGKCESFIVVLEQLQKAGMNVVVDRLHLTELVYGDERHAVCKKELMVLDEFLSKLDAILVHVKPENIELSNKLAGRDMSKLYEQFKRECMMTHIDVLETSWSRLEYTAYLILKKVNQYDFYFASPFFNPEQVEREERLKAKLRSLGYTVFSPKEASFVKDDTPFNEREATFKGNCDAIRKSKCVFAVTDGKDVGTIWESGYAYASKVPIIYYAETLGDKQFNLMLAQSGIRVFTDFEQLTKENIDLLLDTDTIVNYNGRIE